MKALVLKACNDLRYEQAPDPRPGARDVLVQVVACGICGSDLHGLDGSTGRRVPPLIMGHEAAGVIAEAGEEVTGWRAGDRVTFDSTIFCGECWYCQRGQINLCERRRVLGVSCDEYRQDGAFAEYVAIPQHILHRLPEGLDFTAAAMVEPLAVAQHAASLAPEVEGAQVLVIGAGVIGLLLLQVLRHAGAARVIAVDLDPHRLSFARQLGAEEAVTPEGNDVPAVVHELTHGRGADVAFEVVGIGGTVNTAIQSLRKGGVLVQVGNLAPRVEVPLQAIVARQLSVRGSCASSGEFALCLELMARGIVKVAPLISATAPLSEGASWFARLLRGGEHLIKVMLEP